MNCTFKLVSLLITCVQQSDVEQGMERYSFQESEEVTFLRTCDSLRQVRRSAAAARVDAQNQPIIFNVQFQILELKHFRPFQPW